MGVKKLGQAVLPVEGAGRRRGESRSAMLRRWLMDCPQCAAVWLAVGARENDRHICKDCGHEFVVRFSAPPPAPPRPTISIKGGERRVVSEPDAD